MGLGMMEASPAQASAVKTAISRKAISTTASGISKTFEALNGLSDHFLWQVFRPIFIVRVISTNSKLSTMLLDVGPLS